MLDMGAVGGGAFRKDGYVLAGGQDVGDFPVDELGVAAAAPFQEDGVVDSGQPADDRPMPDLFLGNEGAGAGGVDDENIQP